jgi:hypothetical protein
MDVATELREIAQGISDIYYNNRQTEQQFRYLTYRLRLLAGSIEKQNAPAKSAEPAPEGANNVVNHDSPACEHQFVNHIMPGRKPVCKKCGIMRS